MRSTRSAAALACWTTVAAAAAGCGGGGGGGGGAAGPTTWTILVYGHGDHNLSTSLAIDMNEMEKVGSTAGFNIVVQADFNQDESARSGILSAGVPATGTHRYLLQRETTDQVLIASAPVQSLPEQDMDSPAVLAEFVRWGVTTYPANRVALVLWDHGGSWNGGFGGDTDEGADSGSPMSTRQIHDAVASGLASAGFARKLDVVGFDTCLMGSVEVMADFVDLTDVFIACAELDYGPGWDYQATFGFIRANPSATSTVIAQREVSDWQAHHSATPSDQVFRTHAAFDLTDYAALRAALDGFADALRAALPAERATISRERYNSTQYAVGDFDPDVGKDYVDLGDFASRITMRAAAPGLVTASQSLETAISAVVIDESLGTEKQDAAGLSIFFPLAGGVTPDATPVAQYSSLTFSANSTWPAFLADYAATAAADAPPTVTFVSVTNQNTVSQGTPATVTFDTPSADAAEACIEVGTVLGSGEILLLGEILCDEIPGAGTYSGQWDGFLPAISDGSVTLFTGGVTLDTGSNLRLWPALVTRPGGPAEARALIVDLAAQRVIGATQTTASGTVSVVDPDTALPAGTVIVPVYVIEDPATGQTRTSPSSFSVTVPAGGPSTLVVGLADATPGSYAAYVAVYDSFGDADAFTLGLTKP